MISIHQKMTVWESFEIEDNLKEALKGFLKENPKADYLEIYDWAIDNGKEVPLTEITDGTQEILWKRDGDSPTLEILSDEETIHTN